MRILKPRRFCLCLFCLAGLVLNLAGCGGDAYEKQFDDSLQHLKSTGQPLGRAQAVPQADPGAPPAATDQQQPVQQ